MASWMPTYLVKVRHLDLLSMGALSTIPSIASFLSMIAGGVLLDRWLAGKEKIFVAVCALLTGLFIYLMFNAPSVGMVILYETLSGITGTFIVIAVGLQPLKRFSQEVIGTAMGIVNFGGQAAGFVAPLLIGMTVKAFNGSYDVALWILVAIMVVCAIAAMTWPAERKTTVLPASPTQAG
jgi:sugar phosphate permease